MDVRVGDLLPTPRHGKPVEVNAYWYNALRIMEMFASELGMEYTGYGVLSDKVRTSFRQQFWNEEKGCLKDLISGTKADTQIRCNQIWAVSMPFGMMDEEQERQVVRTVYEKLYTLTDCGHWKKRTRSSIRFTEENDQARSGISPGNGVGLPAWGLLSGVFESTRVQ